MLTIYQGHHGDHGAARADVILPGAAYTEKDGLYVNTEGRVQQAKRASFPPGEAREDWKILRALSETLGKTLPYDTDVQIRERICREWPHLGAIDQVVSAEPAKFGKKGKLSKEPFRSPVTHYYLTNPICRASDTMRACTRDFGVEDNHIAEAAE